MIRTITATIIFTLYILLIAPLYSEHKPSKHSEDLKKALKAKQKLCDLKPGVVPHKGHGNYKPKGELTLKLLWAHGDGQNKQLKQVIKEKEAAVTVTYLHIPGSMYNLLLLDGHPSPYILDQMEWRLWYLDGLGDYYRQATRVSVADGVVKISWVEAVSDLDMEWRLNFNKVNGLTVIYEEF